MKHYKYKSLADELSLKIENKEWREHEKLLSIRALADSYQVSKITVQKALHTLEARGIVYVKAKSGYYVAALKKTLPINNVLKIIETPKLINMPDIFLDIMQRGAAFDIAPPNIEINKSTNNKPSSHLLLLNRHISRAMRKFSHNNAYYYAEPAGDLTLRQQISEHYRKRQVNISAEDICITSGCQNSLFLALTYICKPGDIVAVESPAFYGVLQLLQQLKLQVVELPCSYATGLSSATLEEAVKKWHIKVCILTANFATPTGALMPNKEKKEIVTFAANNNITLIEDDIYGDLGFHGKVTSLKSYDLTGNVILCSSFSKSLSRDLRIGWIVLNNKNKELVHLKLINQLSTSQAYQQGLASFLAEGHFERHLNHYRKQLHAQIEQLANGIANHWQTPNNFIIPDGGLAIWVELPNSVDTLELYQRAIAEGIVITPGRLFSSTNKFNNFLRLSFAQPTTGHRLQALNRIGQLINK